jgi:hypothetical protein
MDDCCNKLDDWFDEPLERLYQMKDRLEIIDVLETKFIVYYRCKRCGQLWEQHNEPFSRIEMYIVLKSFPDENGKPRELYFDFHHLEITFQDTEEKLRFAYPEKRSSGCLLSWLDVRMK